MTTFLGYLLKVYLLGRCLCHVFYSSSTPEVADILKSISDGFKRTHFAV